MTPAEWSPFKSALIASWPGLARILNDPSLEREWLLTVGRAEADVARAALESLRERFAGERVTPNLGAVEAAIRGVVGRRARELREARAAAGTADDVVDYRQWLLDRLNEFQGAYVNYSHTPERAAIILRDINSLRDELGLGPYSEAAS